MEKYLTRRAIINALYDFAHPQDFRTVLNHHEIIFAAQKIRLSDEDIRDVRAEWNYLIGKGYLVPIPGYDDYVKLSGEIRSELDARQALGSVPSRLESDERLYGPAALK